MVITYKHKSWELGEVDPKWLAWIISLIRINDPISDNMLVRLCGVRRVR